MIEIQGKHCTAKVFTDTVEAEAIGQILQLCNQDFVAGSKAKEVLDLELYRETMKNVYSTSVCAGTLDEAPMAYKPIEEIIANIADTVDIISIIKPVYNFKST